MHWPFRTNLTRPSTPGSLGTGITLGGGRGAGRNRSRPVSGLSFFERDLVPDYIVNFLRGETPESLARKRELREQLQDLNHQGLRRNGTSRFTEAVRSSAGHRRTDSRPSLFDKIFPGARARRRCLPAGWRGGVVMLLLANLLMLIVSIVCLALAATRTHTTLGGESSLRDGSCGRVRAASMGIRAVVNVEAVVLIASAGYVFQVLSSPTRAEVNAAHARHRWLDVGVPSVRNLGSVAAGRGVLSAAIVLIAVGSQVIYNSLIFTTIHSSSSDIFSSKSTDPSDSSCSLTLSGPLLGTISLLNLISLLATSLALLRSPSAPLVTVGDAIASFLANADPTTHGACLLTKSDLRKGHWGGPEPKVWEGRRLRWMHTASWVAWLAWVVAWLVPVGLTAGAVAVTIGNNYTGASPPFAHVKSAYRFPTNGPDAGLSIIAALPQLLLGVLYLSTDALLTSFLASHEISMFAVPGRLMPLRVSSRPAGEQYATTYLALPRVYSWLLVVLFAGMGFVLSLAVSFVATGDDGHGHSRGIELWLLPLVILLCLLVVMGGAVGGLSLRRGPLVSSDVDGTNQGNPLCIPSGPCSAVLSARCHRLPFEGEDLTLRGLSWGVVHEGMGGHATFSGQQVGVVSVGRSYY